tara:strand:- start:12224 stop:12412 length:189 start_codon:yes stop_codon:yes gene_type:complete
MSKPSKSVPDPKKADQAASPKAITLRDFKEFGRITTEDLNDFFDNDVMSSMTATAKRRLDRR